MILQLLPDRFRETLSPLKNWHRELKILTEDGITSHPLPQGTCCFYLRKHTTQSTSISHTANSQRNTIYCQSHNIHQLHCSTTEKSERIIFIKTRPQRKWCVGAIAYLRSQSTTHRLFFLCSHCVERPALLIIIMSSFIAVTCCTLTDIMTKTHTLQITQFIP